MKTITDYTIYCTNMQTDQALALGAPIEFQEDASHDDGKSSINPTAEQMIGWLEEQGFYIQIDNMASTVGVDFRSIYDKIKTSRSEATLAAIDAALDYLSKNKK